MNSRTRSVRSGPVDALRCFAMLAVIGLHAHLLPFGWIGVWLFYVISGYVVTLSVLSLDDSVPRWARLEGFMRRRVARILPLYYAYIAFGLALGVALGLRQSGFSLVSLFLFVDNIAMALGQGRVAGWPSGHLWTLSVEMQFYALCGGVMCLASRRATCAMFATFIVVAPLARFVVGNWLLGNGWSPLDAAFAIYVGPSLHFDIFAMGGLLAFAKIDGRLPALAPRLALAGAAAFVLYFAVFVAINITVRNAHGTAALRNVASGILIGEHREALLYSAVGVAMAGLVALAASDHRWVRPLLQLRPLHRIGEISFGGYVFHPLGLKLATMLIAAAGLRAHHGGPAIHLLQFTIGLAVTLVLAALSFRWFETPVQRWIVNRPQQRVPAEPVALGLEPR